ncbi:MAG: hypothetical protein LBU69_02560 [Deltaproteobacteria bacterium]|nr:hypothetical protein [Deltaproteobacteria bacterium]
MSDALTREIIEALNDRRTVKALGTVDSSGAPRLAVKESLRLNGDGLLEYDEIIETSRTNANALRALWFGGTVSVLLLTAEGRSFLINGRPTRTIVSGSAFQERYQALRKTGLDTDLGAIWVIEPLSLEETTLEKRRQEEEAKHPLIRHLDRLVVS